MDGALLGCYFYRTPGSCNGVYINAARKEGQGRNKEGSDQILRTGMAFSLLLNFLDTWHGDALCHPTKRYVADNRSIS
jgi:hypothetical protein